MLNGLHLRAPCRRSCGPTEPMMLFTGAEAGKGMGRGKSTGNANPAARSLGNHRGTGEIVPFVERAFEWGGGFSQNLCPF